MWLKVHFKVYRLLLNKGRQKKYILSTGCSLLMRQGSQQVGIIFGNLVIGFF